MAVADILPMSPLLAVLEDLAEGTGDRAGTPTSCFLAGKKSCAKWIPEDTILEPEETLYSKGT
eukprot:scaffold119874_cov21-Cyclotella_meneghiniana.AAC.1